MAPVRCVVVRICEQCIRGEGEECHNPDCILCRHRVDLPLMEELMTEVEWDEIRQVWTSRWRKVEER